MGITTQAALVRFQNSGSAHAAGDPSDKASGNGSIMRLAPVPIRYLDLFPDRTTELAAESSLPTHASPQCLAACRYLAVLLAGLMQGVERNEAMSPYWPPLVELHGDLPLHDLILQVAQGSYRHSPDIRGQIAGAYWGETGTPPEWPQGLARRDLIEQALAGLM